MSTLDSDKPRTPKRARFAADAWMSKLIPVVLGLILLGLVATLVITVLSILGITPGM